LERELHDKKNKMAEIIEISNAAYEARDKAQAEMIALKQQADQVCKHRCITTVLPLKLPLNTHVPLIPRIYPCALAFHHQIHAHLC
jgi:hypothetical protein